MKALMLLMLLFPLAVSASSEIYRWRDGAGVLHFSNSLDDVPLRFREKVRVMNYGGLQKGDAVPSQVAPSATQSPATGISVPQGANGRPEASPTGRIQRHRQRGGRSEATAE